MLLLFSIRVTECPSVREELFMRFTVRVFDDHFISVCVCASFLLVLRVGCRI